MQPMEILSYVGQTEVPGWSGVPGWSIIPGPHAGASWLAMKSEFRGSKSNERSPQDSWGLGPHEQSCVLPVPWGAAQSPQFFVCPLPPRASSKGSTTVRPHEGDFGVF